MRVLNYHGVVDRATEGTHYSYLFTDIADFGEQIAFLKRNVCPVSLAELEHSLTGGPPLPDRAVHVSFDDGYRNNLVAAEILERNGVPWSLFVIVDAVFDGYEPWFLRLANAVRATSAVTLPDGSRFDLSTQAKKRRFAKLAKAEIMSMADGDQDGAVDQIVTLSGMRVPSETAWPLLTPEELQQLHDSGVEIGNHSARHRNLLRCPDRELHSEVVASVDRLERQLGSPVRYFAYPDGRHDRRVRRVAGSRHSLALATWTARSATRQVAVRRYEPADGSELGAILDGPEPWYGRRWAGWTLPWRARETALRVRPGRRRLTSNKA